MPGGYRCEQICAFDFTGTNVGAALEENGPFVERSMLSVSGAPALKLSFDVLEPLQSTPTQTVYLQSNLNGRTAEQGNYQIGLTGNFNAEPVVDLTLPDVKPPAITGGLIAFGVVDDRTRPRHREPHDRGRY